MKQRRRNYEATINLIMVAAVLCVVVRTCLLHTPELVSYGAEFGEVAYDASLAYATAWFFQWLVIALPQRSERERLHQVLSPRIDHLIELGIELGTMVRAEAAQELAFPVERTEVQFVYEKTDPHADAPGWMADWHQAVEDIASSAATQRAALKPFYAKLENDLLELLEAEEKQLSLLARVAKASAELGWKDMRKWATPMSDWLDAVERIRQHRLTHLEPTRAVPVPNKQRLESQRVPMGHLGQVRRGMEEFRSYLDGETTNQDG